MNCMFVAATKFLGVPPKQNEDGTVHEDWVIDKAIELGMKPCAVSAFPTGTTPDGLMVDAYSYDDASDRMDQFVAKYNCIVLGLGSDGVYHAEFSEPGCHPDWNNFNSIKRLILDLGE